MLGKVVEFFRGRGAGDKPLRDSQFDQAVKRNLEGIAKEDSGDIAGAIELYEQNVSESFDGSHPYDRLAVLYRRLGRFADEERVMRAAIKAFEERAHPDRGDRLPKLAKFYERLRAATGRAYSGRLNER